DFAFGASSRSSKMLHGGIRYLEQRDLSLVREALQERDLLLKNAPHLTRMRDFLFPVIPKRSRSAWQINLGLSLYSLLAKNFHAQASVGPHKKSLFRHASSPSSIESRKLESMGLCFSKLFTYFDGQMDDARIVIENIVDAGVLGALTINYACIEELRLAKTVNDKYWQVKWKCNISNESFESKAKFVVNAAGSWAPELHNIAYPQDKEEWGKKLPTVIFSRGSHLLFSQPWPTSGVILPTPTKGRYYFVWPYYAPGAQATMVGTTEIPLTNNEENSLSSQQEVEELLGYLRRDLPNSHLNESTLYRTFSGVRTLVIPSRSHKRANFFAKNTGTSNISRTHVWIERDSYLCLLGGKFTNARATAEEASQKIHMLFGKNRDRTYGEESTRHRPLPGAKDWSEHEKNKLIEKLVSVFTQRANCFSDRQKSAALPSIQLEANNAVMRFGIRAKALLDEKYNIAKFDPVISDFASPLLQAQIRYAIIQEQAVKIEDILRRRLSITLLPAGQVRGLEEAKRELLSLSYRNHKEIDKDISDYQNSWIGK
ncbi:MAG: FAD-dependent oxidoreductase, partial [Deltaproteobacteria bacterium]|nr:FAD-dependent oxidoreductase [Deltaproteobacteria bacterium]